MSQLNAATLWHKTHSSEFPIWSHVNSDLQTNLAKHSVGLPTASDLQGAAEAMIRLQETYDLPTNDTAHGIIRGVHARQSLGRDDCYEIGKAAVAAQQYGFGVQWLELAVEGLELVGQWVADALYLLGESYEIVGACVYFFKLARPQLHGEVSFWAICSTNLVQCTLYASTLYKITYILNLIHRAKLFSLSDRHIWQSSWGPECRTR